MLFLCIWTYNIIKLNYKFYNIFGSNWKERVMINHLKNQDFVKFKQAVTKTINRKVRNHSSIQSQNGEFKQIQNIKNLFKQINSN